MHSEKDVIGKSMFRNRRLFYGITSVLLLMAFYETAAFLARHIQETYLFHPMTFRQDHITNKKWSAYKQPVRVEYGVVRGRLWKIRFVIGEAEARTIIKELKRGTWTPNERLPVNGNGEQMGWVRIVTYVPGKELEWKVRKVLLEFHGDVAEGVYAVNGGVVRVPEELKELLRERFKQTEIQPTVVLPFETSGEPALPLRSLPTTKQTGV